MSQPKIIIESHIPFIPEGFLAGAAQVLRLSPGEITPETVRDACAVLVRTRTRCNAALLGGSQVRLVATATIGTDHIDLPWCADNGIRVVSAPGCNAPAVAQYVWASIFTLLPEDWQRITLGIVGLGHVGSIIADWGRRLGVDIMACDPPRRIADGGWNPQNPAMAGNEPCVSLEEIAARADVVTFHTPHTMSGDFPTHHMAGSSFFNDLSRCRVVINAARGPVVDTEAILNALTAKESLSAAVDCWEGEPALNRELLELAAIATPHIAGYSTEGKQRATHAALSALIDILRHERLITPQDAADALKGLPAPPPAIPCGLEITPQEVLASYNPLADTAVLKRGFTPSVFESLRNNYPLRHELGF